MAATTYRAQLWDVAVDQYGYVATSDAASLDIPTVELRKLAARGFLKHVARGLYRVPVLPRTEFDEYMEAVLWVGRDAVLSHDAVLALHDLAFANPATIRVTTPHRVRKTYPRRDISIVHAVVPSGECATYRGIPATTVARALLDCRQLIMTSRLLEAAGEARNEGLLLTDEHARVVRELKAGR
jgi:predicted transcriptional regulator of viral defense system